MTKPVVGASVPSHINQYIGLCSYITRRSKSKVLQSLINVWYVEQSKEKPFNTLIDNLINQLNMEWKEKKAQILANKNPKQLSSMFARFKDEIASDLRKKGLDEELITVINKGIEL